MTTTKSPNANRIHFYDQADKDAELARLGQLAAEWSARPKTRKYAKTVRARIRKVRGWVVGA